MSTRLMLTVCGTIATIAAVALVALALPGHDGALGAARPAKTLTPAATRPLTSILGVLRRPQTAADRNRALIGLLHDYYHHNKYATLNVGLDGLPMLSLMRLARVTPWGQRIYVVPFLPPTAAQKRQMPAKWRAAGGTPTTATLAVYPMSGKKITAFIENSPDSAFIEGGRGIGNGAYDTNVYDHPRQVIMVVPDDVAKVALWYPTGSIANHPEHPVTPGSKPVVVTVHDNIAAFIAPPRFERPAPFARPGQEIWYGPDGKIVKRIENASSCGPPLGTCA